jgi:hypothetical protein
MSMRSLAAAKAAGAEATAARCKARQGTAAVVKPPRQFPGREEKQATTKSLEHCFFFFSLHVFWVLDPNIYHISLFSDICRSSQGLVYMLIGAIIEFFLPCFALRGRYPFCFFSWFLFRAALGGRWHSGQHHWCLEPSGTVRALCETRSTQHGGSVLLYCTPCQSSDGGSGKYEHQTFCPPTLSFIYLFMDGLLSRGLSDGVVEQGTGQGMGYGNRNGKGNGKDDTAALTAQH